MSALSIQPTYPIFTDIDGQPLEDGFVWIGQDNLDPQVNPINVFWDAALTIHAGQPIRTLGGYPSNSGTPARLYVNSDYSIRVMNKNGSVVYSAPAATERYSDVVVSGVNAEDVIYDPPFANAVQTNVEAKLAQTVSVKDFGAVGNGVADDTAAIQAAISSGAKVITGSGLTYLISTELDGAANVTLRDMTLTAPALPSNEYLLNFSGTEGTPQTLGGNYAEGVFGMTVPDGAAFAVGDWAFLASSEYWADPASDNVTYGEYVQIASISGNDLTFSQSTLLKYETTASATISPINLLKNIRLENVRLIAPVSPGNQGGIKINYCGNVTLSNVWSEDCDYTHILIERSVQVSVLGGGGSRTGSQEGLDYGVTVARGSYDVLVDGYRGDAMRHIVTIGGSSGVSRHISVVNCRGYNLTDGGMDSHSSVHEHTFSNNFLHFADDVDVTIDGIIVQGSAPIVTGNSIYNCKRHGIAWQPETLAAFTGSVSAVIANNMIDQQRNTGSTSGVIVSTPTVSGLAAISGASISNNHVRGFSNGVLVQATAVTIKNVSVTDTKCLSPMRGRGFYAAASGADIDGLSVIGGHYETDNVTTNPVIDLFGASTFFIKNWRVVGANMKRGSSGTFGLRLLRTANGYEQSCTTDNVTTKYSVDVDSTGITLDWSKSNIVTHSVSTTYTVLPQDRAVIANRAATITLTLPPAASWKGRELFIKTIQAQSVDSASANVAPIGDSVAGTAILPATDGAWAMLRSDGTNWIIMQQG